MPPVPPNSPDPTTPEPFPREPIHPDLLAWIQQTTDREEFMADAREVLEGRGHTLESFLPELLARAKARTE